MHCDDIRRIVEKLADGECTEPERARAEAHMAECASCRDHFRFVQALPEAARKIPLPEPVGAYWEVLPRKVMARIEKEQSPRESRGWLSQILATPHLRWLGALAAGVVAVVLSYEVLRLEHTRQPGTDMEPVEKPASLEETRPAEPSKAVPDVVAGDVTDGKQQESPEVGGSLARARPSSVPAKRTPPAPATARLVSPTEAARAPQESEDEAEGSEGPKVSPELIAGRGPAPPETEAATTAVATEEEQRPRSARPAAPPVRASPKTPEVAVRALRESSKTEAEAGEDEQLRDYSVMKQASRDSKGVTPVVFGEKDRGTTSVSVAELEAKCRDLRESVDASAGIDHLEDVRYRLAKCSIELFGLRPSEDDRSQASQDASAYLELFPEGEHADEIRKLLDQIPEQ